MSTSTKSVLKIGKYQAATKPNNRGYSQKRGVAWSDQELGSVVGPGARVSVHASIPPKEQQEVRPFEPLRGASG